MCAPRMSDCCTQFGWVQPGQLFSAGYSRAHIHALNSKSAVQRVDILLHLFYVCYKSAPKLERGNRNGILRRYVSSVELRRGGGSWRTSMERQDLTGQVEKIHRKNETNLKIQKTNDLLYASQKMVFAYKIFSRALSG